MSDRTYSPFSDRPLSRSSMARSHSRSNIDRYARCGDPTPDRYLSSDDGRAEWMLRDDDYEGGRHTPFDRDRQLVPLPGRHIGEAWGPDFSHRFSSYSYPDGDWSGGDFDVEDRRYYQDERRREVHRWAHTAEPRIPRSGIQYVRSESVRRRHPHIMGYHAQYAIDGELRERWGAGYGYVFGCERYMAGLWGWDLEAELYRKRCLDGYAIRRRKYLG